MKKENLKKIYLKVTDFSSSSKERPPLGYNNLVQRKIKAEIKTCFISSQKNILYYLNNLNYLRYRYIVENELKKEGEGDLELYKRFLEKSVLRNERYSKKILNTKEDYNCYIVSKNIFAVVVIIGSGVSFPLYLHTETLLGCKFKLRFLNKPKFNEFEKKVLLAQYSVDILPALK